MNYNSRSHHGVALNLISMMGREDSTRQGRAENMKLCANFEQLKGTKGVLKYIS